MNSWLHIQNWEWHSHNTWLRIDLPVRYLLDTSFLLAACIVAMLLYMLFFLWSYMVRGKKIAQSKELARNLISQVAIAENIEEVQVILAADGGIQKALGSRLGRKIFTSELLKIRKGLSGGAVANIQWLYQNLELQQDSLKRLSSSKWHLQAAAIQQLSQMGSKEHITRIYPFTNHKNIYVRTEAQLALVKMTGFEGLLFLNALAHPLTQWQQVCLMQQLSMQADVAPEQVAGWLQSGNETVRELALKIVGAFKLYSLLDAVKLCLQHRSEAVQQEALRTLNELDPDATNLLMQQEQHTTTAMLPLKETA